MKIKVVKKINTYTKQPHEKFVLPPFPGNFNLTAHLDIPLSSAKCSQARLLPDTFSLACRRLIQNVVLPPGALTCSQLSPDGGGKTAGISGTALADTKPSYLIIHHYRTPREATTSQSFAVCLHRTGLQVNLIRTSAHAVLCTRPLGCVIPYCSEMILMMIICFS